MTGVQTCALPIYLYRADFKKTNLEGTRFHQANLKEADFSNAINFSIDPFNNKIEKAKFSKPDVYSFLKFFDIIIEE